MIRRARMQGFEVLWVPGMDHAGIATQVVVERELRKEGIDRRDIGREAFVERVWAWKEQYGGEIVDQIKRMGASLDWSRERFTMDEGLSRAVREAFVRWYDEGLIYRGERLVNWCPTDQTGLSDSEVEHEDIEGELVTFRYPLSDGSGSIACATTRVETMLGDTGIAVHPDDERYANLIGTTVSSSVRRAGDPDRRGPRDRPGVRDRRREGHARARPDRLRDRAAGRAAAHEHLPRGRDDQRERGRGVLRARAVRRADRGAGGAGEARSDRRGDPTVRPLGGALLSVPQRDRAVDRGPAVVRRRRPVARSREGCRARRSHHVLARSVADART